MAGKLLLVVHIGLFIDNMSFPVRCSCTCGHPKKSIIPMGQFFFPVMYRNSYQLAKAFSRGKLTDSVLLLTVSSINGLLQYKRVQEKVLWGT